MIGDGVGDATGAAGAAAPLDIIMLRIGCCLTDPGDGPPRHLETGIGKEIPIASADGYNSNANSPESAISAIAISDMVECLCLAALKEQFKPELLVIME